MAVEIKTKNIVIVKCDNPGCTTELTWVEQEPETYPEGVFRLLAVSRFATTGLPPGSKEKIIFCGKYCLLQWLKTYQSAKSFKELEEEKKQIEKEETNQIIEKVVEETK